MRFKKSFSLGFVEKAVVTSLSFGLNLADFVRLINPLLPAMPATTTYVLHHGLLNLRYDYLDIRTCNPIGGLHRSVLHVQNGFTIFR